MKTCDVQKITAKGPFACLIIVIPIPLKIIYGQTVTLSSLTKTSKIREKTKALKHIYMYRTDPP